jgi:hypothetical protein
MAVTFRDARMSGSEFRIECRSTLEVPQGGLGLPGVP